jgi:hypothetical protein
MFGYKYLAEMQDRKIFVCINMMVSVNQIDRNAGTLKVKKHCSTS